MRYGVPGASRPCMVAAGYGRESSGISAGLAPGMGGLFNTTNCHLYHYARNNPVKYTDPDGEIVTNNTKFYVLLRTEHDNFIVLPPHSVYTGENVANYKDSGLVDEGKIDGIILSNGRIYKISDSSRINEKLSIENGVNGNIAITINKGVFAIEISFSNLKSEVMNLCGDTGKIVYEKRFDLSGYTKAGKKGAGQWISRGLTQEELKNLHTEYGTENQSVFYTEKEIHDIANIPLPEKKWSWPWQKED